MLAKNFQLDDLILGQMVFQEWERVVEVLRRMREVDGSESMRNADRCAYEERISQLERTVAHETATASEADSDRGELRRRLDRAEATIRSVSSTVAAYSTQKQPTVSPYDAASYLRNRVTDLLRELDSRFIAPPQVPSQMTSQMASTPTSVVPPSSDRVTYVQPARVEDWRSSPMVPLQGSVSSIPRLSHRGPGTPLQLSPGRMSPPYVW